ncbi:MAG: preprotein translocase subunit SecE [Eubacterium sp.]
MATEENAKTGVFRSLKNWFAGLKAEFKKIIWPDKPSICKQTIAVVIVTVILGALIKVIDMLVQLGLEYLM